MEPLKVSPGLRVIDHSVAGEGYWNYIKMAIQTEDVITSIEFLRPQLQQMHEFDWSSGHKKSLEGGLAISSMNYGYGGKGNLKMRSSIMTIGDVGMRDAFMYKIIDNVTKVVTWSLYNNGAENKTVTQIDCRVNVGDQQIMTFDAANNTPPPPFFKLDAPYIDTPILDKDGKQQYTKKEKKVRMTTGYGGVGKGIKQILWERGLWEDDMVQKLKDDHPDYPELSATYVLSQCTDFKTEQTAMEKLVRSYGHIVKFAPKGHPETAGCGIEYDNGVAKTKFRKINLQVGRNCEEDTISSYVEITIETAKRTARKARSYMRAYLDGSGESHFLIEKYVRLCKCHRNILDMDTTYLKSLQKQQDLEKIQEEIRNSRSEMKKENIIIQKEKVEIKKDVENKRRVKEEIKKLEEQKKRKRKKTPSHNP